MRGDEVAKTQALSPGGVVGVVFGCGAMTIGGLFLYAVIQQLWECAAARAWVATPCTVVTSRFVEGHSKKTSYLEFSFAYQVAGNEFASQRYSIQTMSYESEVAAARSHPVGESATCFVNPTDPKRAVIDREFNFSDSLGPMGAGLWFLFLGMAVVVLALYHDRKRGQKRVRSSSLRNIVRLL